VEPDPATGRRAPLRVRGLHYGWVVAAVTMLVLVTTAGFRSMVGVLIVPLHDEFGWSHGTISVAISLSLLAYGLFAPFAAALHERFGLRRITVGALVVIAAAMAATTAITAPWQLQLLWGLVIGSAAGALAIPLAAIVATRWFVARRGLVTSLMVTSNATGQLVFLPILAATVAVAGWRWACIVIALVAVFLVLPLAGALLRDRPADLGLAPYGGEVVEAVPARQGSPFRAAFRGLALGARSGTFWVLFGSFFVCGASTNGLIGTHLIPAAIDHGVPEITAAGYLAAIGLFDLIGTTLSGWLTDRYDPRLLLFWFYGLRGLSLLMLHSVLGAPNIGLVVFVVFYGLDWVATVPPTVALTADVFGRENVGVVFGWIFAGHQLGAAAAALGAGVIRDDAGSYHWAFLIAGALCMGASAAVTRIRVPRRRAAAPAQT